MNKTTRDKFTSRTLSFLLTAIVFFLCAADLVAKSYQIPLIRVETRVLPDGRLAVNEQIQYRFKGRYSYAYRTIPLRPGEQVSDISVRENEVDYQLAGDEEPGTYQVEGEDSGFEVRWNFRARDETRTFRMSYTIAGAIHRYPDTAELHYRFLGEGWSKEIGLLEARVALPEGTDSHSISAWVRDPVRGAVQIDGRSILFSARNWPRRQAFSGRVLFPTAAVASLPLETSEPMKAQIEQAEEKSRAEALAAEETRQDLVATLFPWMFVLPLATGILWYLLFLQHGQRYKVRTSVPSGHLPSQDPLFARWVRHRMVGGETLVATLFDLARRGYLQIREEVPPTDRARKKGQNDYYFEILKRSRQDLRPFERDLVDFAADQLGDARGFRISDLKRVAKKQQSKFQKWFRRWSKSFKKEATEENIFEPYPVGAMVLNISLGLFCVFAGLGVTLWTSSPTGLPAIILGAVQTALTGLLSRRTREGERLFQEWGEFRNQIRRGNGEHLQLQQHWDATLIAAVSLGLVKKFNRLLENANHDLVPVPWFHTINGDLSGVSGISSSIQSMVSTVSSSAASAASAAGAGAAASGGGGGGAG